MCIRDSFSDTALVADWAANSASKVPPGSTGPLPGSAPMTYCFAPSLNDGGTSFAPAPNVVFGVVPSVKSSRPPPVANDSGSHALVVRTPFTLSVWTYLAAEPGALISMLPLSRVIVILSNSGVLTSSSALPGMAGKMPIADHTYQEPMAPRSSFPASPSGPGVNSSCCTRRTRSWVLYGCPAHAYSHGAGMAGSLPM